MVEQFDRIINTNRMCSKSAHFICIVLYSINGSQIKMPRKGLKTQMIAGHQRLNSFAE